MNIPVRLSSLVYLRVVINGESWGIYVNAQQFNKDFVREWFQTSEGARWKVPGSPGGRGGLEYLGEDIAAYRRTYEIKSKDTGRFHVIPHDANETLGPGRGGMRMAGPAGPPPDMAGQPPFGPVGPGLPGGGRGRGGFGGPGGGPGRGPGGSPELDPLVGVNDATKPLRSRLLAVPALRDRYLGYVRAIATKWLDWRTLGPLVEQRQALIAADVRRDTRKLDSFEAFESGVAALRTFAERRRAYLLTATTP